MPGIDDLARQKQQQNEPLPEDKGFEESTPADVIEADILRMAIKEATREAVQEAVLGLKDALVDVSTRETKVAVREVAVAQSEAQSDARAAELAENLALVKGQLLPELHRQIARIRDRAEREHDLAVEKAFHRALGDWGL